MGIKRNAPVKGFICLFCLICWMNSAFSQYGFAKGAKMLKKMDTSACFVSALWGCAFERVSDRRIIAEYNMNKALIPASTLKTAVTYAAWCLLKPEFHFSTYVEYDGLIKDSVLTGSLFIRGGGDPVLGSGRFPSSSADSVFARILEMVRRAGIREIQGGIIADPGIFDNKLIPGSWIWDDIGNYYGGGTGGLNFNENLMEVVFQAGNQIGEPAKVIRIDPPVEELTFDNEVTTGAENSGDQVIIYGAPYDYHRVFSGSVPKGKKEFIVKGSLPDPALEMVRLLYKYMALNNIIIKFPASTCEQLQKRGIKLSESRVRIGELSSPGLTDIIKVTHEKSINIYTDALLKMTAKVQSGEGSYASGIETVKKFWAGKGLDVSDLHMKDGCGLSVMNRMTPRLQAEMMAVITADKQSEPYINTLNLAGVSGDARSLFPEGPCYQKVRLKSGYMKNVRAYTGIIGGKKGEEIAFSVIINHDGDDSADIKQYIKKLLEMFCGERE